MNNNKERISFFSSGQLEDRYFKKRPFLFDAEKIFIWNNENDVTRISPRQCGQHSPASLTILETGQLSVGQACFAHVRCPLLHLQVTHGSSVVVTDLSSVTFCPFTKHPGKIAQSKPNVSRFFLPVL